MYIYKINILHSLWHEYKNMIETPIKSLSQT